jgi:hypothetical protein
MKQSILTGTISTAILLGMAVFSGAGFKDDSCPETPVTQEPVTLFLVSAMAGGDRWSFQPCVELDRSIAQRIAVTVPYYQLPDRHAKPKLIPGTTSTSAIRRARLLCACG